MSVESEIQKAEQKIKDIKEQILKQKFDPIDPIKSERKKIESTQLKLNMIEKRKMEVALQLLLKKREDELEELMAKLAKQKEEDRYFTTERDKDGNRKLKEGKWLAAMEQAKQELSHAEQLEDKELIKEAEKKISKLNWTKKRLPWENRIMGGIHRFMKNMKENMAEQSKSGNKKGFMQELAEFGDQFNPQKSSRGSSDFGYSYGGSDQSIGKEFENFFGDASDNDIGKEFEGFFEDEKPVKAKKTKKKKSKSRKKKKGSKSKASKQSDETNIYDFDLSQF